MERVGAYFQLYALPVFWTFMKSRREFIELGAGFALVMQSGAAQDNLEEASITQLQEGLMLSRFTSVHLVQKYAERINRVDKSGPRINAVIELNRDAEAIAAALDQE